MLTLYKSGNGELCFEGGEGFITAGGKRLAPGESVSKVGALRELTWGPPSDPNEALRDRVELLRQRRVPPRKVDKKAKKSPFDRLSKTQKALEIKLGNGWRLWDEGKDGLFVMSPSGIKERVRRSTYKALIKSEYFDTVAEHMLRRSSE